VRRVAETEIGGKVVWLYDDARRLSLYYAHLSAQSVQEGDRLEPGDIVGEVGNTGNARTTPPHLHFGIYARGEGPVDPRPFLEVPRGVVTDPDGDRSLLGAWARTRVADTSLRLVPGRRAAVARRLGHGTPVHVDAIVARHYRVRLPDGSRGFVAADDLERADTVLGAATLGDGRNLLDRPSADGLVVADLAADERVEVLGEFGEYRWVRVAGNRAGWIRAD
jgi:SH3-like domain-containing protein